MNEIVKKFLLAPDKFMPERHLRQLRFTYSACRPFTKNKERMQKFKAAGNSRYIYQTELDIACVQHGLARGDFKHLQRLLIKYYVIKHLILLKTLNMMNINVTWLYWFITFLIKSLQVVMLKVKISKTKN